MHARHRSVQLELFPTAVRLTKVVRERNQRRFYLMQAAPTLFGDWTLVSEWGRIGSPGQVKIDTHGSVGGAIQALADSVYLDQNWNLVHATHATRDELELMLETQATAVLCPLTEAYLGEWLRSVGDTVSQDDPVVVLETDKVTVELPAPVNGKLTEVLKNPGDTAEVGEVIGYMEEGDAPAKSADTDATAPVPPPEASDCAPL